MSVFIEEAINHETITLAALPAGAKLDTHGLQLIRAVVTIPRWI
jgi:hypothetical protein